VSRHLALGEGFGAVTRRLAVLAAATVGLVLTVLLGLSPVLVPRVFHGNATLLVSLGAIAVGYSIVSFPRGMFAGKRQLNGFAMTLATEGLTRLVPAVVLFAAGVSLAGVYGLVWGIAPLAAGLAGLIWIRPGNDGPTLPWAVLLKAVGWLMASTLLALGLANLGPVIVTALLTSDPARAGVFAFAFVLFRIPHFIFVSMQTVLLPMFSRAAAQGNVDGLRRAIKQAVFIVLGFGVVSGGAILVAAPFVLDLIFPDGPSLSFTVLVLLAVGNTAFMLVQQVLQQGLLSVAGHRMVAIAWFAGMTLFCASFLLPIDPVKAAIVAQYAGVSATGILLIYALRRAFRGKITAAVDGGHA
jgi:O-antigen/teichoic acid export membrane protein